MSRVTLGSHRADHIPQAGPQLGDPWSRVACVAQIPATQPASQSWALTKNPGSHPVQLLKVPKGVTSCSFPGLTAGSWARRALWTCPGHGASVLAHRQAAGSALWQSGDLRAGPEQRPVCQEDLAWTPGCHQVRGSHDPPELSEDFRDPMVPALPASSGPEPERGSLQPPERGNDRGGYCGAAAVTVRPGA